MEIPETAARIGIAAFLEARLADDETYALAAAYTDRSLGYAPARVLREVAAKRAILVLHSPVWIDWKDSDGDDRTSYECEECEPPGLPNYWPCSTVRLLAAVYADHPDYNPQWAVS